VRRHLAAALAALALAGCGDGGGEGSTTAATTTEQQSATAGEETPGGGKQTTAGPSGRDSRPSAPVPGAKAAAPGVPVDRGGDNSIQTFGAEGEEAARAQAKAELEAYLDARLAGDWPGACASASSEFKGELAKVAAEAPSKVEVEGCAAIMRLLSADAPTAELRAAAQVGRVLSFRVKGDDYAYLIFKGAKGAVMFVAMANDGGEWKVNTIEPSEFSEANLGSTQ
jgi:hypothetical protein